MPEEKTFDPAQFETELIAKLTSDDSPIFVKLNKSINGATASLKKDQKTILDTLKALQAGTGHEGDGEGEGEGDPPKNKGKESAEAADLKRTIAALTKRVDSEAAARKTAEEKAAASEAQNREKARMEAVRAATEGIDWANDKARNTFIAAHQNRVKYDEAGELIVETKDGPIAAADWIKSEAPQHEYLMMPKGQPGTGIVPTGIVVGGKRIGVHEMTDQQILALKPEERAAALASLTQYVSNGNPPS